MKFIIPLMIFAVSITFMLGQTKITDFKSGQKAMITRGSHDSWLVMNNSKEVAFLSPHSGTVNLYSIDLNKLNFIKSNQKGLLLAEYIGYETYTEKYLPLTDFTEGGIDSPEYSPNGKLLVFRRYVEDTTKSKGEMTLFLPYKYSLMIVNTQTKSLGTLVSEKVSAMTFLSDSTVLYQQDENDSSWLKMINIRTKEIENIIPVSSIIRGVTSDNTHILVHEDSKASLYNKETFELTATFDIPQAMQRVTYLGDYLILTPRGEPSSFLKLSNGKVNPIVGSYDYEPTVSSDGEYVIVVSESYGGGIVYKL